MKKGFTLIEFMIIVAILGIISAIVLPMLSNKKSSQPQVNSPSSFGVPTQSQPLETSSLHVRCVAGVQFIVNANGTAQQIIGTNGGGISCQ